jgi:hypothetical protein
MVAGKRTLIIAKTFIEAHAHATTYGLHDWQFVSGVDDFSGADPHTHALEFVGSWYERDDLPRLRERICGRGFDPPHLAQIPRNRVRLLSHDLARDGVIDDAESERTGRDRNKATEH